MIRSVAIERLRGIRSGDVAGLTGISILVGPNSAGKSTVLDAIYIGAAFNPAQAVQEVLARRAGLQNPNRWILYTSHEGNANQGLVAITTEDEFGRVVFMKRPSPDAFDANLSLSVASFPVDNFRSHPDIETFEALLKSLPVQNTRGPLPPGLPVKLVDLSGAAANQRSLPELLTDASERGTRKAAVQLIVDLVDGASDLQILTPRPNTPVVYLSVNELARPTGVLGDGVQALIRICLELGATQGSVLLLEEPEAHMHPAALRQLARAILASAKRKVQVILTTHSIELIDSFLSEADEQSTADLSIHRFSLRSGKLEVFRSDASDAAFARVQVEEDLR